MIQLDQGNTEDTAHPGKAIGTVGVSSNKVAQNPVAVIGLNLANE